tara:strand:+ start:52 stop:531 length:480 start_codon:yes stop_codon:yes gene_type:complete
MAYIRIKKINNKNYAYLVETQKTIKGPRQKVKKYLGRVYDFEKNGFNNGSNINQKSKKKFLQELIIEELISFGFKNKNRLSNKKIMFCPKNFTITKVKNNKEAVIRSNDGYIASFTLQRLLNFKRTDNLDQDANNLAKKFLEAGINISEENFIKFYQLL